MIGSRSQVNNKVSTKSKVFRLPELCSLDYTMLLYVVFFLFVCLFFSPNIYLTLTTCQALF